jgi:MFS family permease
LGGVITATLGWRWVFDINVPIGVAVSLLSIKYISSTTGRTYENRHHLDTFGAVSVTTGLMLLVYSLNSAQNIGIGSIETLELLLSSVIVLAAFLLIEYRSKAPLMPLGFLRSSIFGANTVGLLQVAAFVGMIFILTNYLQQVLGYSALSGGLAFVPMGVVFLVTSGFLSARLVNRFGVKPILISGMTLQTIGYLFLSRISLSLSLSQKATLADCSDQCSSLGLELG